MACHEVSFWGAAICLGLATALSGCAGRTPGTVTVAGNALKPAPAAAEVNPDLRARLGAELRRILDAHGTVAAGLPVGSAGEVTDLRIAETTDHSITLAWSYRNAGDYDQNGEVNAADLTPIGLHFGDTLLSADWAAAQCADGDANREINIADVTPLGINFLARVEGYAVESSATGDVAGSWQLPRTLLQSSGTPPPGGGPLQFTVSIDPAVNGTYFRVRPFVRDGATRLLGPPSEPLRFTYVVAPEGLQASDAEFLDYIELSWSAVPSALSYAVYRDAQAQPLASGLTEPGYQDSAADWAPHTYQVTADFGFTQSGPSAADVGQRKALRGDWHQFGRDALHAKCSPYTVPSQPVVKWTFPTAGDVNSSPAISYDGTIYVGSSDYLYAINPDGSEKWRYWLIGAVDYHSPAIGPDGTIYMTTMSYPTVYALNPDGSEKWKHDLDAAAISPLCVGWDGRIYVAGNFPNGGNQRMWVFSLNPDGSEHWRCYLQVALGIGPRVGRATPAVAYDGTVYLGIGAALAAIGPDGKTEWIFQRDNPDPPDIYDFEDSTPVIRGDGSIIAVGSASLVSISKLGNYMFATKPPDDMLRQSCSPAIGPDGAIYASADDRFYRFSAAGFFEWGYDTGEYRDTSPAVAGDGTVLVPNGEGWGASCLATVTPQGAWIWNLEVIDGMTSSPAIAADGTIYFGTTKSKLYAIGYP